MNCEKLIVESEKQANVIIDEAKIKADKILYDAQKSADSIVQRKDMIEHKLKEFLTAEKELLNRYKKEENI